MVFRLSDMTEVKSFKPVHSLGRFGRSTVLGEFMVTREGAEIIESVLESITGKRLPETETRRQSSLSTAQIRRSHLVRANFGTGKTITLLALSEMLSALGDPKGFDQWRAQFHRFPTVQRQYDILRDKSGGLGFICLTIDMKEKGATPFRDVAVRALHEWLLQNRSEVIFDSEYTAVAEQLASATARMPELLQSALERYAPGLSVEELRQDLLNWDRAKLSLAYQIMEAAAGFSPTRTSIEMRTYYKDACSHLQQEYAGVAVVLDELHHFFTTSANFGTLPVSLADFDAFAVHVNETIAEVAMPCVLVGAVHENLGSYFKGTGTSNDAFQQAVGRFNEHPLTSSISQMELIAGALVQQDGALSNFLRGYPHLQLQSKLIQNLSTTEGDWLQSFPLHPAVVTYLPLLSRRLAQNDRTTFHFIAERVNFLVQEQEALVDGRLNLVLLPEVYRYFSKAIEERDPAVIHSINNALSYCGGGALHRQIMETLACLHIASSVATEDGNFRVRNGVTRQVLTSFLNFPPDKELEQGLKDLTESGYIHLSDRQEYFLTTLGGLSHVELNRRVDTMVDEIDADVYLRHRLKSDYRLRGRTVFQGLHTYKDCVTRSFNSHMLSPEELKAFNDPLGSGVSGSILFLIPSLGWTLDQLKAEVLPELPRLFAKGAVVVLPLRWDEIQPEAIRRQEALKRLKNSTVTQEQQRTIEAKLLEEEEQVDRRLNEFGQPGNWVFHTAFGELQSNKKNLADILQVIVANLYPKFPEFRASNLQTSTLIHGLLERFLPNPVNLRFESSTKGRVDSILTAVGLAQSPPQDPTSYSLKRPSDLKEHPNSIAAWQELEAVDFSSDQPIERLYRRLQAPPYGLLSHMVELYLGVMIRVKGLSVYNRKTGQYIQDLQVSVLKEITQKKDEVFLLEPPSATDDDTLNRLIEVWRLVAQATGSQGYLAADDSAVPDASKRKVLVKDVQGYCDIVSRRVLTPLRQLGEPDEAGELQIQTISDAIGGEEPPAATFQKVLGVAEPVVLEQLRCLVETFGPLLMTLSDQWSNFSAMAAPDPQSYPELADAYEAIMAQRASLDLSKPESVNAMAQSLTSYHPLFISHYSSEHDQLQVSRNEYGISILDSPLFFLLRAMGQISVPVQERSLPRAAPMEAEILSERKQICTVVGSAAMLSNGGYGCRNCPDGGYRLGTATALVRALEERETRLQEDLIQALQSYLLWMEALDTPAYAVEKLGLPSTLTKYLYEHDKQGASALFMLKLSLQATLDGQVDDGVQEHLKQVLKPLNSYLSKVPDQAGGPRRVSLTLQEVFTRVETLLADEGLDVIALDPSNAVDQRRTILSAIEQVLSVESGSVLEIVLRRRSGG